MKVMKNASLHVEVSMRRPAVRPDITTPSFLLSLLQLLFFIKKLLNNMAEEAYHDQDGLGDEDDDLLAGMEETAPQIDQDSLLMRFCPHDSSMLYPQEDKSNRSLRYACRLCRYTEASNNPMIYKNVLKKEVGNVLATVPSSVSDDPTLPRSDQVTCPSCSHHEAVFFQGDTSDARSDSLALIFVCCNCDAKWIA
jgi:DNA-directed RNA polymerase II subunit RPB9